MTFPYANTNQMDFAWHDEPDGAMTCSHGDLCGRVERMAQGWRASINEEADEALKHETFKTPREAQAWVEREIKQDRPTPPTLP